MFTQIFQAVENISTQSPPSVGGPPDSPSPPSNSTDSSSPLSSGQLAESALLNLRKSLASKRSSSPSSSSKNAPVKEHRSSKSTLEDRLRAAAFAIGEASNPSSTAVSARVSPAPSNPGPTSQRPISPCSTPLPESLSDSDPIEQEVDMPSAPPVLSTLTNSTIQSPQSESSPQISTEILALSPVGPHPHPADQSDVTTLSVQLEDLPETARLAQDDRSDSSASTDVESLQERLKQVEQRFTGTRC